mmetsp:Transcript_11480/g.32962  ORF Transcript_11480/g.32962 Transcript_11480/m.32962 type:complete len:221 (+) Transcript_11480:480-1142(+)
MAENFLDLWSDLRSREVGPCQWQALFLLFEQMRKHHFLVRHHEVAEVGHALSCLETVDGGAELVQVGFKSFVVRDGLLGVHEASLQERNHDLILVVMVRMHVGEMGAPELLDAVRLPELDSAAAALACLECLDHHLHLAAQRVMGMDPSVLLLRVVPRLLFVGCELWADLVLGIGRIEGRLGTIASVGGHRVGVVADDDCGCHCEKSCSLFCVCCVCCAA